MRIVCAITVRVVVGDDEALVPKASFACLWTLATSLVGTAGEGPDVLRNGACAHARRDRHRRRRRRDARTQ